MSVAKLVYLHFCLLFKLSFQVEAKGSEKSLQFSFTFLVTRSSAAKIVHKWPTSFILSKSQENLISMI